MATEIATCDVCGKTYTEGEAGLTPSELLRGHRAGRHGLYDAADLKALDTEDERVRALLIRSATSNADDIGASASKLLTVTEAIIVDLGTMTSSGVCRLCDHDHTTKAIDGDETRAFTPGHGDVCDCDLPQVEAAPATT